MLISQLLNPEPASRPAEHVRTSDASVNSSTLTTAVLPIPTSSTPIDGPDDSNILSVQENVYLNRKTTLVKLFTYTRNAAAVEYPATHAQRPVGHLFEVDPDDWFNPRLNFAYSQGEPSGSRTTENGKAIFCQLLVDTDGNKVPCKVSQFTCQGCKVCPYADMESLQAPHEMATRDQLRLRLQESQKLLNVDITQRALFSKTLSLYRAYRVHGCLGPASPSVFPTPPPEDTEDAWLTRLQQILRGHDAKVQNRCFPLGTGWKGLVHLKSLQDEKMPPEDCYIRYMAEIPLEGLPTHDEDDPEPAVSTDRMLRVIICMKPASSRRLLAAQYVQSDIAFKRVAGFLEFELGGLDLSANIAVTYCRVYLNRQTAYAHAFVFKQIEQIVREDTGTSLQWRHLHSDSLEDHVGILQWAGDQHGGQAKGLGLHLQSIAAALPPRYDLHQTHRLLSSLTVYEHLWRIFRLCRIHVERNIKTSSVPENVKHKMRSLICVTHHDFEGTLRDISKEGGKKGADWVQDKICCKFAFPGICWERSFIPRPIWQVANSTMNVLESLHADVNREGKFCSLVGGVKKGQFFDDMKLRSLEAFERTGVRPSYKSGHKSENISQGLKRSMVARRKTLASEDDNIHTANKRLRSANDDVSRASTDLSQAQRRLESYPENDGFVRELKKAERRKGAADADFAKVLASSSSVKGTGTGRVGLLLPNDP
ncbi:hypothetical protein FIBSPDRAFT_901216 [Athelia psychrophila]|uniref:Uncharacterized protein n=1 Tax=Athelia psychrophila TaxID=1759441 RepID=A0A165XF70_9AGAM|nr:hypothetical protein FIBSPDRAFT_901216 [Fibularhizoctonia sp. CBS 109695]